MADPTLTHDTDGGDGFEQYRRQLMARRGHLLLWHQSWIVRAAFLASLVLFCGYGMSIYLTRESVATVARITHPQELSQTLARHMAALRDMHELRQEVLLERLARVIPQRLRQSSTGTVSSKTLHGWLADARASEAMHVDGYELSPLTMAESAELRGLQTPAVAWLERERLRVFNFAVVFPRSELYTQFEEVHLAKQTYEQVGTKLHDEIQPALLRSTVIALLATFLLLATAFFFLAREFRARTESVLAGFRYWSEKAPRFRFADAWSGELRLITEQFNEMADEVDANRRRAIYLEKIASWQTIARKLAHEIKNPLTPIQMMVSQLRRRYNGDDAEFLKLLEDAQEIITEEVNALRRMVDNFSQFARLPVPHLQPASLNRLVYNVVELERAAFSQHDIRAESSANGEAIVNVDEDLMRRVLINLIKNAGEASGEQPAKITASVRESSDHYDVVVQDNGPGIPEELQHKVFEAYFTTKHTGPAPGMGLGLAVCQKIVMDHGGDLTVTSRPGDTRFTIKLPKLKEGHQT